MAENERDIQRIHSTWLELNPPMTYRSALQIIFAMACMGLCPAVLRGVAEEQALQVLQRRASQPAGIEAPVELTVKVIALSDKRVRVAGTTNLPSGTELMLDVKEEVENGFFGQSTCAVSDSGTYESEAFGPAGGLKDGLYVASVTMPIPAVQPPEVRRIIGDKGEKLRGPLVEGGKFGPTVSQASKFSIGGATAVLAQTERTKQAEADTIELRGQLCVLLEELLEFKDKPDFKVYGFGTAGPYKGWLERVEKLSAEQPKGIHQIPFELRVATGDLLMMGMDCVKGKETDYWRNMLPEIQDTIGFADYLKKKRASIDAANEAKLRTWRDSSGKFSVEASFAGLQGNAVLLKKNDGSLITVPLQRLSEADQRVAKRQESQR